MEQFHFDPDTYLEMVRAEVPAYDRLQGAVVSASAGVPATRILDLGAGTGVTSQGVLAVHSGAALVVLDESPAMLAHARRVLPGEVEQRVGRLEDALPAGPFDLVISALAVHHLDGPGKADLFVRVARLLAPRGRFVLGDVIVPDDPADVVTPVDGVHDRPSPLPDQLDWLRAAGLRPTVAWRERDLAVVVSVAGGAPG